MAVAPCRTLRVITFALVTSATEACVGWSTAGSVLGLVSAADSPGGLQSWSLDRMVGDLAASLLLVAWTGLALACALALTATAAAQRMPTLAAACSRATPRICRRLVAVAVGVGLVTPVVVCAPALAGEPSGPRHGSAALDGLGYPDLPSESTRLQRSESATRHVVVRGGDSLWLIAEQRLPAGTPIGDVAEATWRLYAANRAVIGPDPDVIYPGTTLLLPEGSS